MLKLFHRIVADILKGLHTHNYSMKHTQDSGMCTETLEMPKKNPWAPGFK